MPESILLIYSLSSLNNKSDAEAILKKLKQSSQGLSVTVINADCSEAELHEKYGIWKQKNIGICLSSSMILAIGKEGLDALCTLNDARLLDSVRVKVGLSIREYSTKIQELQFTLAFIAIPASTLDSNAEKIMIGIPHQVLSLTALAKNHEVPLPIEQDASLVVEGIKQIFHSTYLNTAMNKLDRMLQWAEVFGLGLTAEAMRREYLEPSKAVLVSGALIFSCMYRNRNTIRSHYTSNVPTCKLKQ